MTIPAASSTSAAYRDALLALQKQQRAQLTTLIQQTEAALHEDWTRGPGIVAQYYAPLIDQYARALNDLRALHDDPAARLSLDWLAGQDQSLRQIEANVRYTLDKYATEGVDAVTAAQRAAANAGLTDASALTQEALSPAWEKGVNPAMLFSRPNPDAIAAWVGRAGNGHPLGDLFSNFSSEATSAARQAMLLGLATGANPLQMVSGIQQAMGISRSRAITIARTEVLGSYRAAAHETYRQNADVLGYWLWSAGGNNPCFPAGTMIRLANGSERAIEDVQLGDWVWTHRGRVRRVTGVMSRGYTGELITFDWPGMYRVTATAEHPFLVWYGGEARWLWACRVKPGLHQHFMMDFDDNGEPSMRLCYCNSQSEEVTQTPVYNLEVADDESYVANGFVVHNCAMCMGMDGTLHGLEESLDDHPCGKCAPLPVTKPWSDILGPLGIDASDLEETSIGAPGAYETGEEKFARMSPVRQQQIIGTKTGYEAYQRGEVSLRDFVGVRPPQDGFPSSYYQKSLREMQIPTKAQGPLVEPSPAIRGPHRASARGQVTPDALMPAWAKQSEASRIVYQILRNGLPYDMTAHEQALLILNLQHMITEEVLPDDVFYAAVRQLRALGVRVKWTK